MRVCERMTGTQSRSVEYFRAALAWECNIEDQIKTSPKPVRAQPLIDDTTIHRIPTCAPGPDARVPNSQIRLSIGEIQRKRLELMMSASHQSRHKLQYQPRDNLHCPSTSSQEPSSTLADSKASHHCCPQRRKHHLSLARHVASASGRPGGKLLRSEGSTTLPKQYGRRRFHSHPGSNKSECSTDCNFRGRIPI